MKHSLAPAVIGLASLAISSAALAAPAAKVNPLRVNMYALDGAVEVIYTNTSHHTLRVPKWELPSSSPEGQQFFISRDGKPVAYQGRMTKRGLPKAEDFAILRAGQSYRTIVDLAASYDMSKAGQYTVTFSSPMQYASLSTGEMLKRDNDTPMLATSVTLSTFMKGTGFGPNALKAKPGGGTTTVVNGVTFAGCSSTQISQAGQAVVDARGYTENAKGYLAANNTGERYTWWFGAFNTSRYSTMNQHFVAIDGAMDQSAGQIKINCACSGSEYAHVYPNSAYEIFVCRAFWPAPAKGTDSKAGTLIHEMSHFNVVAGTNDWVYGQTGAHNLSISNPTNAVDNADNHEYFAENTPNRN
ncbi:M35 family metalloendopeptidase [Lysobacter fragariae]